MASSHWVSSTVVWVRIMIFINMSTLMFNDVVQPPWCCPRERDLEEVEREE